MSQLSPTTLAAIKLSGSDRLWGDLDESTRLGVEHIRAALDEVLSACGGEICTTHRTDLVARFSAPEDAIRWACLLQQELLEVDWPEELVEHSEASEMRGEDDELLYRGLRVGVGIELGIAARRLNWHSGEHELVGDVVEQACALAELAGAGSILASSEMIGALDADSLQALDADIEEFHPQKISIPTCYAVFPRQLARRRQHLVSQTSGRQANLPSYQTRFFGRTFEVGALAELVDEVPSWVTIVGTPGVGKTRLAVEFARRWIGEPTREEREAWFCDLAESPSVEDALYTVARVLGVPLPPTQDVDEVGERLASSLEGRDAVLMVIDNAEDLIDGLAAVMGSWLDRGANLVLVVTSRRLAGHAQESALELDALGAEPARILLQDRLATPRGVELHFGDHDRQALQEIVERCGELPLAIELAAASGRRLSPNQLLRAWQEDEDTAPMAHLEQAIERTFRMLEPYEQQALVQCSVFAGGFTVEAACEVVDLSNFDQRRSVSDVIETLHAHSLLRSRAGRESVEETRLSIYSPVREFAAVRRTEGATVSGRRRHAEHFLKWGERACEGLRGADETYWIERLAEELANLVQAYEFSVDDNPELAVRLVVVLREIDKRIGPLGGQQERAEVAFELAEKLADERGRTDLLARALLVRAQTRIWSQNSDGADADFARAEEIAREDGDRVLLIRALDGLAFSVGLRAEYRKSLDFAEQALALARDTGTLEEVNALSWTAMALSSLDRHEECVRYLNEALVLARQIGNPRTLARVLGTLGTALSTDQRVEGRRCLSEAIEIFRAQNNRRRVTFALFDLGRVWGWDGEYEREERCYDEALEVCASMGDSLHKALLLQARARSKFMRGQYARAEGDLLEALTNLESEPYLDLSVWISLYLGASYAALDRLTEADKFFKKAEDAIENTEAAKLRTILEVLRGFEAAARARKAFADDDTEVADAEVERALVAYRYPRQEDVPHVNEAHAAARSLKAVLDAQVEAGLLPTHAGLAEHVIEVGADTRWFAIDRGEHVDISRRGALRKILAALIDSRFASPGTPLSVDDVMAAGWPDEVLTPTSGARRVYSTINRMRELGLEDVLETVDDGYMINPAVTPVRSKRRE